MMTSKEHKALARRLILRAIASYKQKLILEEDLLSGEDKRLILEQIDKIRDSIKFEKEDRNRWVKKRKQ